MTKLLTIAAALCLTACATTDPAVTSASLLAGAVTYEKGVQQRCPRNVLEWSLHMNARVTFDLTLRAKMTEFDSNLLEQVRVETNQKCPAIPTFMPTSP